MKTYTAKKPSHVNCTTAYLNFLFVIREDIVKTM